MHQSKTLLTALLLGAAHAKPLSPSKVTRQNPSPSNYPLDNACDNEWKYLNFNSGNNEDRARLEKLHKVVCEGDLRAVASWGAFAASATNAIYDIFFDEEPDVNEVVYEVLLAISGGQLDTIGAEVGKMIIDNRDFGESEGTRCTEGVLAYTATDRDGDGREKIHFCGIAYEKTVLSSDVDCGTLDSYPSLKMDTLSRIALHETLHYKAIGDIKGESIVDAKNADGNYAFDPDRAYGLRDTEQDDNPALAEINADNYAWMSLDACISSRCHREAGNEGDYTSFFPEKPPKYS